MVWLRLTINKSPTLKKPKILHGGIHLKKKTQKTNKQTNSLTQATVVYL